MKNKRFSVPRFLIYTFSAFTFFSSVAAAQTIEPDAQIVRQMIAYVAQVERTARPVIASRQQPTIEKYERRQRASIVGNERKTSSASAFERQAFGILNEQRCAAGLPPLQWNEDMARAARLHSENMARGKFFSHTGLDGSKVGDRAETFAERTWHGIGENIAFNKGFKQPVESACQQWMNSPGHRANLLNGGWSESGVGAAFAPDGSFYITQVFIR